MGAGVMGGGPQGWVLAGHWPCSTPLALLSTPPALLSAQGAGEMT